MGEMDPELMFAAGLGLKLKAAEGLPMPFHPTYDVESRLGGLPVGPDAILDRHSASLVAAQGGIDLSRIHTGMAVDPGDVVFPHTPRFQELAQGSCGCGRLGDQDHPARFPVEAMDQTRFPVPGGIQPHA